MVRPVQELGGDLQQRALRGELVAARAEGREGEEKKGGEGEEERGEGRGGGWKEKWTGGAREES